MHVPKPLRKFKTGYDVILERYEVDVERVDGYGTVGDVEDVRIGEDSFGEFGDAGEEYDSMLGLVFQGGG